MPKHRTVVFVHGCFWHRHKGCKDATTPKSHRKFWADKFARNVANDRKHLRRLGWRVAIVWECQLKHPDKVLSNLKKFMKSRFTTENTEGTEIDREDRPVGRRKRRLPSFTPAALSPVFAPPL